MIDIKFLRENPEVVKENIRKKFQDEKLPLVDEVIALDLESRKTQTEADELRAKANKIAKQIGGLMKQGKKEEAEQVKQEVAGINRRIAELEPKEAEIYILPAPMLETFAPTRILVKCIDPAKAPAAMRVTDCGTGKSL